MDQRARSFLQMVALGAALATAACGDDGSGETDGGGADAATDAGEMGDAARDGSSASDAGEDASTPMDAGTDGAAADDAGADGAAGEDGGASDVIVIHGCDEASFVDATDNPADRVVDFDDSGYAPKCIRVAPDQSVAFKGVFTAHPLRPGTAPSRSADPAGSAGNPITATDTGTIATFAFPESGTYPYYCDNHHASGQIGVVYVE